MKKLYVVLSLFTASTIALAQEAPPDSAAKFTEPATITTPPDTAAKPAESSPVPAEVKTSAVDSTSASKPDTVPAVSAPDTANANAILSSDTLNKKITDMGVAVAPATLAFRVKPGKSETKYVTITNDTYKPNKFKISFSDFTMDRGGSIVQVPIGKDGEFGLTKWIMASPSFVELKPGEKKKIAVTITLPDEDSANKSVCALMMIDLTKEREYIVPSDAMEGNYVMGVIPTYGFGVYIYQNPPNVKINKVEITSFTFNYDSLNKYVRIMAKNVGDGMGFCKSFVEITNLNTGKSEKFPLRQFTIFPGLERDLDFVIPGSISKGNYSAMAVLDFGSNEEIEAAEVEFKVE